MKATNNWSSREAGGSFSAAPLFLAVIYLIATSSFAGSVYHTPAAGSKERAELMNVIRPSAVQHFGQPVVFTVTVCRVTQEWALIIGGAVQPDGSFIDYKKAPMYKEDPKSVQGALDAGALSNSVVALLKMKNGKWHIVTINFGATDAPWVTYDKDFGAPLFLIEPLTDEEKART